MCSQFGHHFHCTERTDERDGTGQQDTAYLHGLQGSLMVFPLPLQAGHVLHNASIRKNAASVRKVDQPDGLERSFSFYNAAYTAARLAFLGLSAGFGCSSIAGRAGLVDIHKYFPLAAIGCFQKGQPYLQQVE